MVQISVIIPTYKPGDYLFECLDSVMNQTLGIDKYEVLLILNGPRNPYYKKIGEYARRFVNIRIAYEELGSVSNARNVGMQKAIGTFFCFVDDDDIVSHDYLEELLKISTTNIVGVSNVHSFTNSIKNYRDDFFACKVIQKQKYPRSLFRNRSLLSFPVAKLIHKEIVGERKFDLRYANGEDVVFFTQISDRIDGFAFTPLSVCYYVRKREGSATRRKIGGIKLLKDIYSIINTLAKIYFSNPSSYNLILFLSRIPGLIKGGLWIYFQGRKSI